MAVVKLTTVIIILLADLFLLENAFGRKHPCISRSYGMDSIVCVCNATYFDTICRITSLPSSTYALYISNQAGLRFKKRKHLFIATVNDHIDKKYITVDPNITYQTIIGWGGGFSDASAFNIHYLSDGTKANLLKSYFSKQGIQYNLGRVPMGSNDFSSHFYTYDDGEEDEELKNFKLAPEDYKYKIPLLKQANQLTNNTLWLLASAWSAPKWMVTNYKHHRNTSLGPMLPWASPNWMETNNQQYKINFLRPPMYQAWANYFLKFLDLYWEQWVDFWGITTGNQPTGHGNTVLWLPEQMRFWINNYLGPTLRNSSFKSLKLLAFDDEIRLLSRYIDKLFWSKETRNYTDGIAVHSNTNSKFSFNSLGLIHKHFPNMLVLNTEASMANIKKVSLGAWQNGENYVNDMIMNLNNWVMGWIEPNLALDMAGGPTYARSSDAPIIVNAAADEFYKQPMFYAIGHFSKFIPRGSTRIHISILPYYYEQLKMVAFKKPDNGTVIVILNRKPNKIPIVINDKQRGNIDIIIEPKSFTTILYW